MSHALIWTELSTSDLNSTINREIPYAGFGTVAVESWNKRLYKLRWLNSSVDDIKIWLDNEFADIYVNSEFATIKSTDGLSIVSDIGFDFRITSLDTYNLFNLPNSLVATNLNIPSESVGGVNRLKIPYYVDGVKVLGDSKILVKNQTSAAENGFYDIFATTNTVTSGAATSALIYYKAEDIITAGKIVSFGSSSWYAYMEGYTPFQSAASGTTGVIWVDRTTTYKLADVDVATTSNLSTGAGSALTIATNIIDNVQIALNDRVLVKAQTDKRQNGIYYVSGLYASGKNTIVNTNTSTNSLDNFWDTALTNISRNIPVSTQILNGNTYGGKYYRYYSAIAATSGGGTTNSFAWTDATHFYDNLNVDYYYEVGSGSGIGFSFDTISAGTLTSTPSHINNFSGISVTTSSSEKVLVKHFNPAYSGVYTVNTVGVGTGFNSVWVRNSSFISGTGFTHAVIKVTNNKSEINSQYFYLGKTKPYLSNFVLNSDTIDISHRYLPYTYEPVKNLISTQISDFSKVIASKFANTGIGISQRVLVNGQSTSPQQNGIYTVKASAGDTFGLGFSNTYQIVNGALATSSGTATTYFLYSSMENVSAGSTSVAFVDITSASIITVDAITVKDRITSGQYISPDDFNTGIATSDKILVDTTSTTINGIYDATVGAAQKGIFNYSDSIKSWFIDIYSNLLSNSNQGSYNISPNFRSQIGGILQAYNTGAATTTRAYDIHGNIYVPELLFPSTADSEKYFTEDYKGSALLQELELDWFKQDFQEYKVKGVLCVSAVSNIPLSSGTAITSRLSDSAFVNNGEDVLVFIGSTSSSGSTCNGIYRAVRASAGSSVYFTKHEEFNISTSFISGTNVKDFGSPYERPTKVRIEKGYFTAGTAFTSDTVYMQGVVGYSANVSALGSSSITPNDTLQYNAGQEIYVKNSTVRLSWNTSNLSSYFKLAPIQHFITGDLTNSDVLDGDMLIVSRGYKLFSLKDNSLVKYYYEIGDRVIYQDSDTGYHESNLPDANGIYQISFINTTTWTYYLRRVKQNSANGHIDHWKRLDIQSGFSITDDSFPVIRYGGSGTTYFWSSDNFPHTKVVVVKSNGDTAEYLENVDYDVFPNDGYLARYNDLGSNGDRFYLYLYNSDETPRYNEVDKSLFNRYYLVEQVLEDKAIASSTSIIKTENIYSKENTYFQVSNTTGYATTTDELYNTDKSLWYNTLDDSKLYNSQLKAVVSIGSTNNYFYTYRPSQDGYIRKVGSAFTADYYDMNQFLPGTGVSTGLFTGGVYLEKVTFSGTSFTTGKWFGSLSLSSSDNILILSNNTSGIASTLQSAYYNDNNELIVHNRSGKHDQKLYKFETDSYYPVSLSYNSGFANPMVALKASDGIDTYFLHFNPAATNRSTDYRKWFKENDSTKYNVDIIATGNISDLDDLGGSVSGAAITHNKTILLRNQSNPVENGVYSTVVNSFYNLERSNDFNTTAQMKALGRTSFNNKTYELVLPDSTPYGIGTSPMNWNLVSVGQTIDSAVRTSSNYSSSDLTSSFPDSIDSYTLSENEKVFLYSQSSAAEKYIGRFTQNILPTLTRVGQGGAGNTSLFSITNCYVLDQNTNNEYELYFNPSFTGVGVSQISWFERNYITNYANVGFASSSGIAISNTFTVSDINFQINNNLQKGTRVLALNQVTNTENGIYATDENISYYLSRYEDLNETSEISLNKRTNVISGNENVGFYALSCTDPANAILGTTALYWAKTIENNVLADADCASTSNINLSGSLPTTIDDFVLEKGSRILLKDQSTTTQNGIYIVTDISNNIWQRASDLNSSIDIVPQLCLTVLNGTDNAGKIYRIKIGNPRAITITNIYEYILDTDNIEWEEVSAEGLFESSPSTWQKIGIGSSNYFNLGFAKLNTDSIASSRRFAVAIKAPSSTVLSNNQINTNGKIRNIKFKVEYKTIED